MKFFKFSLGIMTIGIVFLAAGFALAAGDTNGTPAGDTNNPTGASVSLNNPLSVDTPQALIGLIINAVLGIIGSIALLMFIYGGFTWLTSGGNEQKVTQGRNILMWAALGLVIIFLSYALVKFVITSVGA